MTRLVVVDPIRFLPAEMVPIDILTGFTDSDYISCAFPSFDLANIDLDNSYLDVTSNTIGNFDLGPTDSIPFSASTIPLVQGDSEFRFYRFLLRTVNKQRLTGVRFRISALNATTFKVGAIRAISKYWQYAPIDLDTLHHRVVNPVSPTGSPNYPTVINWPTIFRADSPSGSLDPRPIDGQLSAYFYTGSLTATGRDSGGNFFRYNEFCLYLRETQLSPATQISLDGIYTQDELKALGKQPDFLTLSVSSRPQSTLDPLAQAELDFRPQSELDTIKNTADTAWIKVDLKWDKVGPSLDVRDSIGNGYTWQEFDLAANSYYVLMVSLEGTRMQLQVFETDGLGNLGNVIFDTLKINDPVTFRRRGGRVGWFASLADGDAFVGNLRSWGLNFAEYRSEPFLSNTPVDGAQLQIGGTLSRDLYNGLNSAPWGGEISLDAGKSVSGKAIKVDNLLGTSMAGVGTNQLYFDDWSETTLFFNVFFPSTSSGSLLQLLLLGENGRVVYLGAPSITMDKWDAVKVPLDAYTQNIQPGYYRIFWVQPIGGAPTVWWIDQIHVMARMNTWGARAKPEDAWNMIDSPFVPFGDMINVDNDGIVLPRGQELQLRATARRQDAKISSIKLKPKYATLGNIVWAENRIAPVLPTASFTHTTSGLIVSFTDTSSADILFRFWEFGDETVDYGATPTHTFPNHGTYSVELHVVNKLGFRAATSQVITV